jgi:hypothetical protein
MNGPDFKSFVEYTLKNIAGDDKGEAQVFLDRFFQALGYPDGFKGAGATCEFRIRNEETNSTKFADLVWKPVVLIEMKKKGEDLSIHLQQAFSYWAQLVPDRPRYVILCNFFEFWIYDFNKEIYRPLEKVRLEELPSKTEVFSFLLPKPRLPIFGYNREDITENAAYHISYAYKSLLNRKTEPAKAQRYILQLVLCMFAEDIDLLPEQIFTRLIRELDSDPYDGIGTIARSFDLIGNLFKAMNTPGVVDGGIYKGVDYFDGGLFDTIYPIELTKSEISYIYTASKPKWQNINPAIFGSIFESTLDDPERHKLGAHYTHEIDIKKIVDPVIVQPWNRRIDEAESLEDYFRLLTELGQFKVLDPACGSGNFLFIAFKEMKAIERRLLSEIRAKFNHPAEAESIRAFLQKYKYVTTDQFYGIDIKPLAVELAKVTLMIAKELDWAEHKEAFDNRQNPLPLDNLDQNIMCMDALLDETGQPRSWPEADAIIGNPPYQSKNKMQKEFGVEYINRLRAAYPGIPGRADFCVYWFYKAHQHLKPGCFAGLVGTNTIRQNYSREGSLDYIVKNGGTIFNAVSSLDWSGDAAVFVSIVCWAKGQPGLPRQLFFFDAKNQLLCRELPTINSSLSLATDVTGAKILANNRSPKKVFQGQTHGHEGFLIQKKEGLKLLKEHPDYADILKPFLTGDEFVSNFRSQPDRFVIDFTLKDLFNASTYKEVYKRIEKLVFPDREKKAFEQKEENEEVLKNNSKAKVNKHHINFFNSWWQLSYGREDLLFELKKLSRYITIPEYSKRPIFDFISPEINPNAKLMVFTFEDDYSFGIIQSNFHWLWLKEKGATLAHDTCSYTTNTVWDTFPWPQQPTAGQIEAVAVAAKTLRTERTRVMNENRMSLRDLYRLLEKPGKNPIRDLHETLDQAVAEAYGFDKNADPLSQLLALNLDVAAREQRGQPVQAPGLPGWYPNKKSLVSDDCVRFEG